MRRPAAALALALALAAWPGAAAAQQIRLETVATGLAQPTFVTGAPGDTSRLFYLEKNGRVRVIDTATGSVLPDPFLTLPPTASQGERGLLGLAFHPDYAQNGLFFTNRTDGAGNLQIERYQVSPADPNRAIPTPTTVLSIGHSLASNHNGGWLGFGPDGYLYASTGDGGGGNDTGAGHTAGIGNAQDITDNLLGKMLRIDVDSPPLQGVGYAVPASNPFVGREGDDLIWAYGLRNPWRASFDRETGDLYIGDVGQGSVEEIDFQPASSQGGENYGWRLREGTVPTPPTPGIGGGKPPGNVEPIYEYLHNGASRSVLGGYVYRGPIASLRGQYFFADSISDGVWSIVFDGSPVAEFDAANFISFMDWTQIFAPPGGFRTLSSFGEDELGNLYLVDLGSTVSNGAIYRVVPEPGTGLLLAAGLALLARRRR